MNLYNLARDGVSKFVKRINEPEFEIRNTDSVGHWEGSSCDNYLHYKVLIENIGNETAHDCVPMIYFNGTQRGECGNPTAEITIDTVGCWERQNSSSISLHAGDKEWFDVFRLFEDRGKSGFDPFFDRYIEFPTSNGWNERAEIKFRHIDMEPSNASKKMTRKACTQTYWEEAHIAIRSEEATKEEKLDFVDMNSKMDNSPLFSEFESGIPPN